MLSAFTCNYIHDMYTVAFYYNDVIMSAMASQITSLTIVYPTDFPRRRSKKTWKLRVTGPREGNSPMTGEFPAQRVSNAENVSIWWRYHGFGTHGSLKAADMVCIKKIQFISGNGTYRLHGKRPALTAHHPRVRLRPNFPESHVV